MASLGNTYFIIDDAGSGGSGNQISPEFIVGSFVDAQVVAQHFSTMFNRSVRLVQKGGGAPPWTPLYTPSTCRVLPSPVPQSIVF